MTIRNFLGANSFRPHQFSPADGCSENCPECQGCLVQARGAPLASAGKHKMLGVKFQHKTARNFMKKYELIPHTADIGIKVFGRDLKGLFVNAAVGMYEQIAELNNVQAKETIRIDLEGAGYEELLILWLSELLAQNTIKEKLLKDFQIKELDEKHIVSEAKGEKIDTRRHRLKREVKAVTFHDVKIKKENGVYTTQIIFDV